MIEKDKRDAWFEGAGRVLGVVEDLTQSFFERGQVNILGNDPGAHVFEMHLFFDHGGFDKAGWTRAIEQGQVREPRAGIRSRRNVDVKARDEGWLGGVSGHTLLLTVF